MNVLRKEIIFEKASPVIKICLAHEGGESSTSSRQDSQNQKSRRPGRKRSASKLEDDNLVKKIKAGRNFERNERQMKQLEDMNKGERENIHFFD